MHVTIKKGGPVDANPFHFFSFSMYNLFALQTLRLLDSPIPTLYNASQSVYHSKTNSANKRKFYDENRWKNINNRVVWQQLCVEPREKKTPNERDLLFAYRCCSHMNNAEHMHMTKSNRIMNMKTLHTSQVWAKVRWISVWVVVELMAKIHSTISMHSVYIQRHKTKL